MDALIHQKKNEVLILLNDAYHCRVSDLKHSNELAKKALAISNKLEDVLLIAKCFNHIALIAMIRGENTRALKLGNKALRLFTQLNDEKGIADAKYNLAAVYYKTDNYHLGLVNFIDCLAVYRKHKDYHNEARVQKSLGTIYEYFGDIKNAIVSYQAAIKAAKKVGDLNLESNAYNPLSGIYLKQEQTDKAMKIIKRSIALKQKTGDIRGLAFALYGRGKVYSKINEFDKAERDFFEALAINKQAGDKLGIGMVYCKLGSLYIKTGVQEKAIKMLVQCLEFSSKYNILFIKFKCYYLLYELYKNQNNTTKALYYLECYFKEKEAIINTQSLKIIKSYDLILKMRTIEQEASIEREKAEIIESKNRAEQTAAVKQEFLSTMSHEIRTPLNAVITIASLLSEKTNEEEKQLVDSLKFASNNLLSIINDILDFTKLDSGKAVLERKPVELEGMLTNFKRIYEGLAQEKGLLLTLNIDESVSRIYNIDQSKLLQILGNLTSNAIKFTDKGNVTISVIKVAGSQKADTLRFTVSDTGQGVSPVHKHLIFESFFQPFSITTRKQGGSGLGLAIVKKLVELHNSSILIESELGKGSSFYFDISFEKADSLKPALHIDATFLRGKSVLLAEDNMVNAMVAIKLLKGWGVKTTHARSGIEAVKKAETEVFDYILMDIHMPEMDGYVATQQIRESKNLNAATPIFALTADITAGHNEYYVRYFNGFLRKPIEINVLKRELSGYEK